MTRFLFKAALLLLLVWVAAGLYLSDRLLFERPERRLTHYRDKLSEAIRETHPVAFLMTFDEPDLREWVHGVDALGVNVEAVPARHGRGRQLAGTRWSYIQSPINWRNVHPSFSICMWIKLLPPSEEQDLMFATMQQRRTGLRLEDGQLTFYIPAPGYDQTIAYPFTRWGEFVHITATADPETGVARLYENGVLMTDGPIDTVDFPNHNIEFGTRRWYVMRDPLHAVLDETVIWNKTLPEKEVQRLYRTRRSILSELSPRYYLRYRFLSTLERGVKQAVRYIDYFNPRLHHARAEAADLPAIHLNIRNRHVRHFNLEHHHSRLSGRRTANAADFKSIEFVYGGRAARGELALDGSDTAYGASPRRPFILETGDAPIDGMRSVRLTPPEDAEWLKPLLDARVARHLALPHTKNGLCRLYVNGEFVGLYYYEDDTRRAVAPESGRAFMRGPQSVMDRLFVFQSLIRHQDAPRGPPRDGVPLTKETLLALYDALSAEVMPLLLNDMHAPFSGRELRYRLARQREQIADWWTPAQSETSSEEVAAYLSSFMFLGANPSPWYVREDLDLEIMALPGVSLAWSSSHPEIISATGQVIQPPGDLPVGVTLTAQVSDGTSTATREFDLRVMPETPRVPAMMLYVNDSLQKSRRVDARVERYDGSSHTPQVLRAFQGSRGGVKFRGNTSFWQQRIRRLPDFRLRKMPLSLRFDGPHHLLNETATRHVYFASGYSDTTLTRNKFSYDLFKALSEDNAPRYAAEVEWNEVFVNGHYQGLFEMCTRIDRHLLGYAGFDESQASPAVLYKFEGAGNNFARPNVNAITQKRPPRFYGYHWAPYRQLVRLVREPDGAVFAAQVEEMADVDAVMDYHLLLNLTENVDGINVNLYLTRDAANDAKLFIVPWDYDKTFYPRPRHRWFSNALTSRLMADGRDYPARMAARWEGLRAEALSDEEVLARIDAMERRLDGFIQWDSIHWDHQYCEGRPFDEQMQMLRERAMDRLAHMDEYIPRLADEAEPDVFDQDERERVED